MVKSNADLYLSYRYYIALARQRRPTVSREVSSYVVDSYVRLRKVSKDEEQQNKTHTYTSARTLLGVLRLAQALARLRWSNVVEHSDVDEALRLMECSKESLQDEDDKEPDLDKSPISQIFRLIKSMAGSGSGGSTMRSKRPKRMGKGPDGERDMDIDSDEDSTVLSMTEIRARVLSSGYNEAQLMETITTVSLSGLYCNGRILTLFNSTKTWEFWFVWLIIQKYNLSSCFVIFVFVYLLLSIYSACCNLIKACPYTKQTSKLAATLALY